MGMHVGKQRGTPEKNVSKVANSLSFLTFIVGHIVSPGQLLLLGTQAKSQTRSLNFVKQKHKLLSVLHTPTQGGTLKW